MDTNEEVQALALIPPPPPPPKKGSGYWLRKALMALLFWGCMALMILLALPGLLLLGLICLLVKLLDWALRVLEPR